MARTTDPEPRQKTRPHPEVKETPTLSFSILSSRVTIVPNETLSKTIANPDQNATIPGAWEKSSARMSPVQKTNELNHVVFPQLFSRLTFFATRLKASMDGSVMMIIPGANPISPQQPGG